MLLGGRFIFNEYDRITQTIDNHLFPVWKPYFASGSFNSEYTLKSMLNSERVAYEKLRNSSAGFISRKEVRSYIFKRDGYKCVICNSTEVLTIDHIISVSGCAYRKLIPWEDLNGEGNLQTLCNICNARKPCF